MLRSLHGDAVLYAGAVAVFAFAAGLLGAAVRVGDTLLIRTLDGADAALVLIGDGSERGISRSGIPSPNLLSYPELMSLRSADAFHAVAAIGSFDATVRVSAASPVPDRARGRLVSGDYFELFRGRPQLGRVLTMNDERVGVANVVVLSDAYWKSAFAGASDVVGRRLVINGWPHEIVGVTAGEFEGETLGRMPDLWLPLTAHPHVLRLSAMTDETRTYWLMVFGRLREGLTRSAAARRLEAFFPMAAGVRSSVGASHMFAERTQVLLTPAGRGLTDRGRRVVPGVYAAVGLGLLLFGAACAAFVGVVVARLERLRAELLLRHALGAQRWQVIGRVVPECALLAALVALFGLIVARMLLTAAPGALRALPAGLRLRFEPGWQELATVIGAAVALVAVVIPLVYLAVRSWTDAPSSLLNETTARITPAISRLHRMSMGSLCAVAIIFAYTALLLAGTAHRAGSTPLGVRDDRIVLAGLDFSGDAPADVAAETAAILTYVRQLPGVEAGALGSSAMLGGSYQTASVLVDNDAVDHAEPIVETVTPDMFRALGVPLLAGRGLVATDARSEPTATVVNQAFVDEYLPNRTVLGTWITVGVGPVLVPIVGVVGNVRYASIREPMRPVVYLPSSSRGPLLSTLYVRTSGEPEAVFRTLARAGTLHNSRGSVAWARTLTQQVERTTAADRAVSALATLLAVGSVVVCFCGLYLVFALKLHQHRRAIGTRLALGGTRRGLGWPLWRGVALTVGSGAAAGAGGAMAVGQWVHATVFAAPGGSMLVLVSAVVGVPAILVGLASTVAVGRISRTPVQALLREGE